MLAVKAGQLDGLLDRQAEVQVRQQQVQRPLILLVAADTLVGRGVLAGYGAFAAQADVKVILELQYAEVIRDLHNQICALVPAHNPTLENLQEHYQLQYETLHGSRYPLPACA